jgi:hypothetical protein
MPEQGSHKAGEFGFWGAWAFVVMFEFLDNAGFCDASIVAVPASLLVTDFFGSLWQHPSPFKQTPETCS